MSAKESAYDSGQYTRLLCLSACPRCVESKSKEHDADTDREPIILRETEKMKSKLRMFLHGGCARNSAGDNERGFRHVQN